MVRFTKKNENFLTDLSRIPSPSPAQDLSQMDLEPSYLKRLLFISHSSIIFLNMIHKPVLCPTGWKWLLFQNRSQGSCPRSQVNICDRINILQHHLHSPLFPSTQRGWVRENTILTASHWQAIISSCPTTIVTIRRARPYSLRRNMPLSAKGNRYSGKLPKVSCQLQLCEALKLTNSPISKLEL